MNKIKAILDDARANLSDDDFLDFLYDLEALYLQYLDLNFKDWSEK